MASKVYRVCVNLVESEVVCEPGHITITKKGGDKTKARKIEKGQVKHADWINSGPSGVLQLYTRSNELFAMSPFPKGDEAVICDYFKADFGVTVVRSDGLVTGSVEGDLVFNECSFSLSSEGCPLFTIPYDLINHAQAPPPNDIVLNFTQEPVGTYLTSVRLAVPKDMPRSAKDLLGDITSRVDLTAGTEDYVAMVNNIKFAFPRLVMNLRFCRDLLFLNNAEVAHRVMYDNIDIVHKLELPQTNDDSDVVDEFLVVSLKQMPLRQGQTKYMHLVMRFSNDEKLEGEGLEDDSMGATPVAALFKRIRANVVSSGFYRAPNEDTGIRCSCKAKTGLLYVTDQGFLFVHNPVVFLRFDSISSVEFQDLDNLGKHGTNAFGLQVTTTAGQRQTKFANIDVITGLQVLDSDEPEEVEALKKQKCLEGLMTLVEWMRDHKVKITKRADLREFMSTFKQVAIAGQRRGKIDAQERLRRDVAEAQKVSSDSESGDNFDPDAPSDSGGPDEEESSEDGSANGSGSEDESDE